MRAIEPQDILLHPYDAADRLRDVYVWATGVEADDLIAGRGASEFIWAMGREVNHASAAIPMPAYTDYLKAFPGRGFSRNGEQLPSLEQVDAALTAGTLVIVSSPHNPTGTLLDRDELIAVAADHPESTLVVDESYINFTPDPGGMSVIGCDEPNVVVLRSTSKFFGTPPCVPASPGAATTSGMPACSGARRTGPVRCRRDRRRRGRPRGVGLGRRHAKPHARR
jgi:histidinol-phosphate aminotransferase